jgi:hypothetical protein
MKKHLVFILLSLLLLSPTFVWADGNNDVLYVSATLEMNWTMETAEGTAEGEMSYTVSGVVTINKQFASNAPEHGLQPIDLWYQNSGLTASFTFDEKVTSKDASCPNPIKELHGGGPIKVPSFPPGVLDFKYLGSLTRNTMLGNMPLPAMATDVLKDHYLLVLAAGSAEAHGTKTYKSGDRCKKRKIDLSFSPKIQLAYLTEGTGTITGRQSWSSSQRDFQVKLSNLPPTFNLKSKEPDSPTTDKSMVNYTVRWKIKEPPFVTINSMDPSDDNDPGENITDQKREIWIGKKVTLEARLYPLPKGDDPMNIGSWTIPGSILKRWDAGLDGAQIVEVGKDEFERARIEYYWKAASQDGDSRKLTFTPHKKDCEPGETTFMVKRPAIDLTVMAAQSNSYDYLTFGSQTVSPNCCFTSADLNEQLADECKQLKIMEQNHDQAGINRLLSWNQVPTIDMLCKGLQYNGISFNAELSEELPGEFEYVQLIGVQEEYDYTDQMGKQYTKARSVDLGLDGCYPYPMNEPPTGTRDMPGFILSKVGHRSVTDMFEMYLMFRPPPAYQDGHEWVPIKKVPWSWGATLTCGPKQGFSQNTTQVICTPQDGVFPPVQPPVQDVERYPEWHSCNHGQ